MSDRVGYWRRKVREARDDLEASPTRISARTYTLARADLAELGEGQPVRAAAFRKLANNDQYLEHVAAARAHMIQAAAIAAQFLGAN